ncbi:CopG family transcriptional regulator [Candidatus Micrarchaeota archaeon]|nr:CopG family transcriptional regulator [Candidatus Micrarchaeota archaeon]
MKSVEIPEELYAKIEKRIESTEFGSVSEYVTEAMKELMAKVEGGEELSKKEKEEISKRLASLGYMD